MQKDRTYADDLCVYACSKVLNVQINVYNDTLRWMKFNYESSDLVEVVSIFIFVALIALKKASQSIYRHAASVH